MLIYGKADQQKKILLLDNKNIFMPRKMSIAREIKIQKLQTKNRMTGQTFNPSGITGKEIDIRESRFVTEMKEKGLEYRKNWWKESEEVREIWQYSWPWEWCVFQRYFIFNNEIH